MAVLFQVVPDNISDIVYISVDRMASMRRIERHQNRNSATPHKVFYDVDHQMAMGQSLLRAQQENLYTDLVVSAAGLCNIT